MFSNDTNDNDLPVPNQFNDIPVATLINTEVEEHKYKSDSSQFSGETSIHPDLVDINFSLNVYKADNVIYEEGISSGLPK